MGITNCVEPDIRTMIGSLLYIAAGELVGSAESNLHITIEGETKLISIHMTCDMIHFYYHHHYTLCHHHITYNIWSYLVYLHTHTPCLSVIPYLVSQQNVIKCLHLLAYNCIRSTRINSRNHEKTSKHSAGRHSDDQSSFHRFAITTSPPPPPHCLALLSIIHQINGWTVLTYLTTLQACTDIKSYIYIYIYICAIYNYIYIWWTYFIKLIIYIYT